MRHIHTSIVSRHLATRGNSKILHTPPPHISSSEERLLHLTRRTLAQRRIDKSPFLKSYLHKVDAKSHPSPPCPLCNIHTHDTHHLINCTHIHSTLSPLDLWTDPAGMMSCWPDAEICWQVDQKRDDRTPPPTQTRVKGVGRHNNRLAKQGANMEQEKLQITLKQQNLIMKNMFRAKKIPDDYHTLDRAGQVTISRLRTGHNRLNSHMHRKMNLVPSPLCTRVTDDLTTEHILQRCPACQHLRQQKLYGKKEKLERTVGFIQQADLSV